MRQGGHKHREKIVKSMKIALASIIAIAIAGELGLQYSATAGIITILSIGNTKRETLGSARNRGIAFLCALALAALIFGLLDFHLAAFAVYLFAFAFICLRAGWGEAIAADSVLISHLLTEKSMAWPLILNEVLLFLIGTSMGILVNLHLRKKEEVFWVLAEEVDSQFKEILHRMAEWLPPLDNDPECFTRLRESLEQARLCAAANYNNALLHRDTYELDYIRMREEQSIILEEIYENIRSLTYLPVQARQVAGLLGRIERSYHKDNTVEGLLQDLEELLLAMKKEELPGSREEFEARAVLFYILRQLNSLLTLKRRFIEHKKD